MKEALRQKLIEIQPGDWVKYRGEWAYVSHVNPVHDDLWLSGWNGIKTTSITTAQVQDVSRHGKP